MAIMCYMYAQLASPSSCVALSSVTKQLSLLQRGTESLWRYKTSESTNSISKVKIADYPLQGGKISDTQKCCTSRFRIMLLRHAARLT